MKPRLNPSPRPLSVLRLALLGALWPSPASAVDCTPASGQSPCVPASALWVRPGATPYLLLPDPEPEAPGQVSVSLTGEYQLDPLVFDVPSPDPAGREFAMVRHRVGLTPGARVGLGRGLDLGLSAPLVLFQEGAGVQGVTSRDAEPLTSFALADPRLEARFQLHRSGNFRAAIGSTLLVPLGDAAAHAGERGFVLAPELLASHRFGRLSLSAALQARLRQTVELGGAARGTELGALAAGGFLVVPRWLTLNAELALFSGLKWHTTESPSGATTERLERPALWLLGASMTPSRGLRVLLAAGGALPLSVTEHRAAPSDALASTTQAPRDPQLTAALGGALFHALLSAQYPFD